MGIGTIARLVGLGVAAIFGLTIFFGTFYTIDQGDKGVVLNNGSLSGEVGPGLHFKLPMVQSVYEINMRSQQMAWNGGEGGATITGYTRDKQVATIHMTVTWRVIDATRTYVEYRNEENVAAQVVAPKALEVLKNALGQVDSTQAVTQREKLNSDVLAALQAAVKGFPLVVTTVQITDVSFSDAYDASVAQQVQAQVDVLRAKAEQQKANIDADTKLYSQKAAADAVAYAGIKEAEAINAKGKALQDNPGVVALTTAQAWDGKLPSMMVPGSSVPFLNVNR